MLPPPPARSGTASGYRLAAVLLPVVAAMLLSWSLLDVALGNGRLVIVDGVAEPRDADVLVWAKLASTVSFWLLGLRAGGWAVAHDGPAPRWVQAGFFLLGGVVVPLLLWYAVQPALTIPYAGTLVTAALITVTLAVQVGLAPHRRRSGALETADQTGDPQGARRIRIWPGAAMLAAAVAVSAGVVVVNPYAAPTVRTHARGPATATAVAWPAGQHPVIVTSGGVWFCDDDLCEDVTQVNGGPPTVDGYGTATIGADGTVVKTAVTGRPERGGPFVGYARCVREGCRQAWLPVRATAAEKLDDRARVEVAGAAAPDGALWFFVAAPVAGGTHGRYRLSLVRCPDVACPSPRRHEIGAVDRTPADGYPDGRRARLSVDASGRPAASLWIGRSVLGYTCEPVTCGRPRESAAEAGPPDAMWDMAGEPAPAWRQTVWRCRNTDCVSAPMDVYPGAARRELLAVAPDGRVLVVRDDRIVLLETPPG